MENKINIENLRWYYIRKSTGISLYTFLINKKNRLVTNLKTGERTHLASGIDNSCLESVGLDSLMVIAPGNDIIDYKKIDANILKVAMPKIYKKYVIVDKETGTAYVNEEDIAKMSTYIKTYVYKFNDKVAKAIWNDIQK